MMTRGSLAPDQLRLQIGVQLPAQITLKSHIIHILLGWRDSAEPALPDVADDLPDMAGKSRKTSTLGQCNSASPWTRSQTASAMARDAVNPGDSMPKRFTKPRLPCAWGPSIRKSGFGSSGEPIFGRMPV